MDTAASSGAPTALINQHNYNDSQVAPPPGPPPLLTVQHVKQLCSQGHLSVELPAHLGAQYTTLFAHADDFFALPTSAKKSQYPPAQGTELGYISLEGEKEYLTFRHLASPSTTFEEATKTLWHDTAAYLHRILCDVSNSLDIGSDAWAPILDGCMTIPTSVEQSTPSLLRVFRYEPDAGIADPHRDLGLLTLCVGSGRGLQTFTDPVHSTEGTVFASEPQARGQGEGERGAEAGWSDAQGATVLIGDTLRALCTARVNSGVHRVVGNPLGRNSIVFALRSSTRWPIDLTRFGGWGEVESQELWDAIRSSRVNVNARKDVRESQKAKRVAANC